ncbi:MAG TPA: ABC transporter substrate-binding protein [Stellaceae bacterium]|nr:ABC transporter substrate-binding protein [Stellaceae bacterium]
MIGNGLSRRTVMRGIGGASLGALCPILVSFDAKAAESVKLTLPWIPEGEVAFMFTARKEGFWEKRGLDVTITRGFGSGEAAKTLGLKQYDFGQADIGAMINAMGAGLPLVSIAMVNQHSPVLILSLKGSGIAKPKDLEGKRLGGAPAGAANQLWPAFARANNIDLSKVKMVSLQPGLNIQALTNHDVDALATVYQSSVPYLAADGVPYETMFFAAHGLDIYSLTFATQPDRVKSAPKQVAAFVEGVMEGLKFAYLNPDKALADFIEAIPESGKTERDRKITRHSLLINTAEGLTEDVRRNGLGWHNPQKVARTLEVAESFLKLKSKPALDAIYTNDFVGSVKLTDAEWTEARAKAKDYLLD